MRTNRDSESGFSMGAFAPGPANGRTNSGSNSSRRALRIRWRIGGPELRRLGDHRGATRRVEHTRWERTARRECRRHRAPRSTPGPEAGLRPPRLRGSSPSPHPPQQVVAERLEISHPVCCSKLRKKGAELHSRRRYFEVSASTMKSTAASGVPQPHGRHGDLPASRGRSIRRTRCPPAGIRLVSSIETSLGGSDHFAGQHIGRTLSPCTLPGSSRASGKHRFRCAGGVGGLEGLV